MKSGVAPKVYPKGHDNDHYEEFLVDLRAAADVWLTNAGGRLFTTNTSGLWEAYLSGFATRPLRQHYNCHACRSFIEKYGALVTIHAETGATSSLWQYLKNSKALPARYRASVTAMAERVSRARVTGIFLTGERVWGTPETGVWHHLSFVPTPVAPRNWLAANALLNAGQLMAEKLEDYKMLQGALGTFREATVARAVDLLGAGDVLYRSEKCLGVAKWLLDIYKRKKKAAGYGKQRAENIVWLMVACAPAGWCHVRSSMIGTLLEDLGARMELSEVQRRFREKLNPLQYQRPQAAPEAGNIAQAEKVVAKLGIARSLERRFARIEEIPLLWAPKKPAPRQATTPGVFSHLALYDPREGDAPPERVRQFAGISGTKITAVRFLRDVLPTARSLWYAVPTGYGPFVALLTAVYPDAPPILQWDREKRRNPVSWYVYPQGSPASQWGLVSNLWARVTGVCTFPHQWDEGREFTQHPKGLILLLDGARDRKPDGNGIFPEILRSDLHSIRSTIEAYQRHARPSGYEEASACGVDTRAGDVSVTVRAAGGTFVEYQIDRWE